MSSSTVRQSLPHALPSTLLADPPYLPFLAVAAVDLIWKNAMLFSGADNLVYQQATALSAISSRLFNARAADFGSKYTVTFQMRDQLIDNLSKLSNGDRLLVLDAIRKSCPDAISDYADGTSDFCVSALSMKQFLAADVQARGLFVKATQ